MSDKLVIDCAKFAGQAPPHPAAPASRDLITARGVVIPPHAAKKTPKKG